MRKFFRFGDLLIIDNGSTEAELHRYLEVLEREDAQVYRYPTLASPGEWSHGDTRRVIETNIDPSNMRDRPGLITATRKALDLALAGEYRYVQIVHDDVQFMWHDSKLEERADRVFGQSSDAVMLSVMFFARNYASKSALTFMDQRQAWRHKRLSAIDMGILPVSSYREHGFRFLETTQNNEYWNARGSRLYFLPNPLAAFVPGPAAVRGGVVMGDYRPPPHRYYLRPFDQAQIQRLSAVAGASLPYQDDYCRTWGWASLKPHHLTLFGSDAYVAGILACWRRRDFQFPRWSSAGKPMYFNPSPFKAIPGIALSVFTVLLKRAFRRAAVLAGNTQRARDAGR